MDPSAQPPAKRQKTGTNDPQEPPPAPPPLPSSPTMGTAQNEIGEGVEESNGAIIQQHDDAAGSEDDQTMAEPTHVGGANNSGSDGPVDLPVDNTGLPIDALNAGVPNDLPVAPSTPETGSNNSTGDDSNKNNRLIGVQNSKGSKKRISRFEKTLYFDLENCLGNWGNPDYVELQETVPQADNRSKKDGTKWSVIWQPGTRFNDTECKKSSDGKKMLSIFVKAHNSRRHWNCKLISIQVVAVHTGNPASNGTKDTTVHSLEGSGDDSGDEIANGNAGETKMEGGEAVHEGSEQQLEQPEQQQPSEVPTDGSQQPIVIDSDDAISSPPPVTSSSFCCTQEQIKEAIEHGQKTLSVRDQSATLSQMNMHSTNDDRGWKSFLTYEFAERLVDPVTGTLRLAVTIVRPRPRKTYNSKSKTGMVGLINRGATCYMNALLQTLYHTTALRMAVYKMPTDDDPDGQSVPVALQRVFHDLQTKNTAVDTEALTIAFGWDQYDSYVQHDVSNQIH